MATATKKAKRQIIAKAGNGGGSVHVGQKLYAPNRTNTKVVKIDGDTVTIKYTSGAGSGQRETMPLAAMTALIGDGLVAFTDPHVAEAMQAVQDDSDDDDGGEL